MEAWIPSLCKSLCRRHLKAKDTGFRRPWPARRAPQRRCCAAERRPARNTQLPWPSAFWLSEYELVSRRPGAGQRPEIPPTFLKRLLAATQGKA
ncbi:hypothetical protein HMPREF9946_01731 [Acetobacteraceae bacterium AT-5844]|nr:hypothetical protein HMPREF9946_01731 [Acetobacteraceae bacterium AT-5844]